MTDKDKSRKIQEKIPKHILDYSPKIILEGFKFGNDSVWGGAIKTPENKWFRVTNIYFFYFSLTWLIQMVHF